MNSTKIALYDEEISRRTSDPPRCISWAKVLTDGPKRKIFWQFL
jgi:hypothetical protein